MPEKVTLLLQLRDGLMLLDLLEAFDLFINSVSARDDWLRSRWVEIRDDVIKAWLEEVRMSV